ncbi:hemolysin family protein [Cytobacillus horneckiae]|uniref:hemolysin family protein n=1 Tax=Cytobacillus horneckiae TaxID=549687 RepID=UPI003D9A8908
MDLVTILNLVLLVFLIVATAFFVGAEFAVVKLRMSRIEQLIDEGNKKAEVVKKVARDLDYYLSACQLGITVTALGLGALGKPTVEKLLYPIFELLNISEAVASVLSYAIAFLFVTFLHVVVGEMAPKTLAIQFAEKMSLLLSPTLYWFGKLMYPFIWFLNGASRVLLRIFGVPTVNQEDSYTEEELKIVMVQSYQGGEINQSELEYMENVFSFDERVAKDIMVPRVEMITLDKNMSKDEIVKIIAKFNYTRYPVIDGSKDNIIGMVNVKKMLTKMAAEKNFDLSDFMHPIPYILETTKIHAAFLKMQQERVHITLIVDEYGGTSGLLTIEDVLEELVGEIRDELDNDEIDEIENIHENASLISGRVRLARLEERFGMTFKEKEQVDTIAGWIHYQISAPVKQGDKVSQEGFVWTVMEVENLQIKRVKLEKSTGGEPLRGS